MITEVLMGLGSWEIELREGTPRETLDRLQYFGHVAVVAGRVNPAQYGDELLAMARYVGVLRERHTDDTPRIAGAGMVVWLGDEDDKGEVFESPLVISGQTFPDAIRAILGAGTAVIEGTLHSVVGTYTGRHQWESRRKAIDYVSKTMGAEYRVNGDGTLDAGQQSDVFVSDPTCIIVRHGAAGRDLELTGVAGEMELSRDVADFTTRVVLLAEGEGDATATGSADIISNPYLDIRGNPVVRTRLVSEAETSEGNADARAQLQLNRFTSTRNALSLNASDYDIKGSFQVGDYVWVYDPDAGLYDTSQEATFRGQRINPIKLRVVESSWPLARPMTVAYRHQDGTWYDLTDYVEYEDGDTSIAVGELSRALTHSGTQPADPRPLPDSTIPGVPSFVTPFATSVYLDALGNTRARIIASWTAPNNVDGSAILDGDHYEIRYGPNPAAEWQIAYAPWGETGTVINDLSPGVLYDFGIRAVDSAGNAGAWSATISAVANPDSIAPSTPAPPTVAGSLIAIQVIHDLGRATGGTFNLESDLDHLEVHVGPDAVYTPDDLTLVGKLPANQGMMIATVPAVGTFKIGETTTRHVKVIAVDKAGNKSNASTSATATASLIDDAHISDLTVSKVTAGTIGADWIIGASIKTANSGPRVELNTGGLQAFNASGVQTVDIASADGSVSVIGQLSSGVSGRRIVINPDGSADPEIRFYPDITANFTTLIAKSDVFPNEVTLQIQTGQNNAGTVEGFVSIAAGSIVARITDLAGVQAAGELALTESVTSIGWDDGTVDQQAFQFDKGRTRFFGNWRNSTSGNSGLYCSHRFHTGSGDVVSVTLGYGLTFQSRPGPLVTLNDDKTGFNNEDLVPCHVNNWSTTGVDVLFGDGVGAGSPGASLPFEYFIWAFAI